MKIYAMCTNEKCADRGVVKLVEVGTIHGQTFSDGLRCHLCQNTMRVTNVRGGRIGKSRPL